MSRPQVIRSVRDIPPYEEGVASLEQKRRKERKRRERERECGRRTELEF